MTVRKTVGTVGTLAQEAVSTAVSVARHPIGTTALAAGFVRGAAGAGIGLLRATITGTSPTPHSETVPAETPGETLTPEGEAPAEQAPAEEAPEHDPVERDLPGPDLAHFEPPRPEDLPEPIVIEADDTPAGNGESGEPFHNEPKATSRDSEHGAGPLDSTELDELSEELPVTDEVETRA
jgi:hypothetical protein